MITVRDPREGGPFALSDDLRGSPDFFLGNGGVGILRATIAAGRAWGRDFNKRPDKITAVLSRGVGGESSPLSALAGGGVGAEAESELGGATAVGKPAQVKITPECSGSISGATRSEIRREPCGEASRLGIWERGAVEEFLEQWISRGGGLVWVVNTVEAIAETFGHVEVEKVCLFMTAAAWA